MGINLQSLSLTSAFSSIVSFFKSQENAQKWRDLSSGAEGTFLIRLLANVFSTLSYRIVAQSRENYLSTAALPSSNIGLSVNLGYSAFRGSNLKRLVRLTPNGDYVLPKFSVIGSFNELYSIYNLEDIDLKAGEVTDIKTVVGNLKQEEITVGTSSIKVFTLFTTGISEDYALYLDTETNEVPTTSVIKQMTEDKYLVRTNPYSSVDIIYLNTFPDAKYKYGVDSKLYLKYIELADVGTSAFTDGMFTYGTLEGVSNISTYLPFESVEQMKVNAPLDHETQNIIRSKQDYANRLKQIVPSIIDTGWTAVTPTYTQISYLKNDFTLLTEAEETGVQKLLKDENFFGTPLPDITPPRREVAHLNIKLALMNKYKNVADINLDIDNILATYYNSVLGSTFNTFDLERKLESLSYVKYARVSHVINERKPNTAYQLGYILDYDDKTYMASKILGSSGESAPNWNLPNSVPSEIDTGLTTRDGSLVWRAYKLLPNMPRLNFVERQNNRQYGIGDFVYDSVQAPNYMFKCVDLIKTSGFSAPNVRLSEPGQFIVDGNLVWVTKEYSESYNTWESATVYSLGDSVNTETNSAVSLECVSYTGATDPGYNVNFELDEYPIIAQGSDTFTVAGNKTFYFWKDDEISAVQPAGATNFAVASSTYNGVNTVIKVTTDIDPNIQYTGLITVKRGTKDGQILWTVVDDLTNITYPWNSYAVFDHTLEIIE